ncbi:HDOD domain-containing protein (plasmid) [Methylomarinum sp. Ch1-1]|uniref:HDOD domain-containing protein n=1 Tax=Methylomarinum roseum TaxID=3067653 RepID=A0AAU7P1I1_9GAMM|nr:HDOD domain-containing protein [Methylomarinum sp. Ch1-1]MDP4523287.1 HDOD domain-containing protein [Methylomarinum sp. Ch1-1]
MSTRTAISIINHPFELFALPDIYYKVSNLIESPDSSLDAIAALIRKDPGLSTKLLKLVNSPLYGFRTKVDTISRASVLVGIEEIRNMILSTSVLEVFDQIPYELIDMHAFWVRSIQCGVMCKLLAEASGVLHCERLFLAGLLHKLGSLVLYHTKPKESLKILEKAGRNDSCILFLENKEFGFTHAEVGGELMRFWRLPDSLSEAISCYPTPEKAKEFLLEANILSIATELIYLAEQGTPPEQGIPQINIKSLNIMMLTTAQVAEVVARFTEEFAKVFEVIMPNNSCCNNT